MSHLHKQLYAPPQPGQYLEVLGRDAAENERLATLARGLTADMERPADQVEALYRHVARDIAKTETYQTRTYRRRHAQAVGEGTPGL